MCSSVSGYFPILTSACFLDCQLWIIVMFSACLYSNPCYRHTHVTCPPLSACTLHMTLLTKDAAPQHVKHETKRKDDWLWLFTKVQ